MHSSVDVTISVYCLHPTILFLDDKCHIKHWECFFFVHMHSLASTENAPLSVVPSCTLSLFLKIVFCYAALSFCSAHAVRLVSFDIMGLEWNQSQSQSFTALSLFFWSVVTWICMRSETHSSLVCQKKRAPSFLPLIFCRGSATCP